MTVVEIAIESEELFGEAEYAVGRCFSEVIDRSKKMNKEMKEEKVGCSGVEVCTHLRARRRRKRWNR